MSWNCGTLKNYETTSGAQFRALLEFLTGLISISKYNTPPVRFLCRILYKRNGKSMTQMEVQENGMTIVYDREIKGDEMHVKITYGNLVANRVFKRL